MSRGGGLDARADRRGDGDDHALHPLHRERLHDREGARLEDGGGDGRLHLPARLRDGRPRARVHARRPASEWHRDDAPARRRRAGGRLLHLPDVRARLPARAATPARSTAARSRSAAARRSTARAAATRCRTSRRAAPRASSAGCSAAAPRSGRVGGSLAELPAGSSGVVERLEGDPELLARLTAQGVAPGVSRPPAPAAAHVRDRGRRDHDRAREGRGRGDRAPAVLASGRGGAEDRRACGIAAPSCRGSEAPKCTPPGRAITAWP